ncbi:MAG: energy-coupling factor transporter transmembrane component T family protein [Anaerolineales bacterium]
MQRNALYIKTDSELDRLHPLTKASLSLILLAAAATAPDLIILLLVFVLLEVPVALLGKITRPFIGQCVAVVTPFIVSLAVIQGFFTPGETVLFSLWRFTFTLEGLLSGFTVAGRILVAIGGAFLLMLSTRPDKLMLALTQRGLPGNLAYVVLTSVQIYPRFQDRARIILEAQQSRGLETQVNVFKRVPLLLPLFGPLILSSLLDVEERAMALEARAFSRRGPKTSLIRLEDTAGQRLLRAMLTLFTVALVVTRLLLAFR